MLESRRFGIAPMTEADVADVMNIELVVFPDPWTPLAYLEELRHNPRATYLVAREADAGDAEGAGGAEGAGELLGYVGCWDRDGFFSITNIAVAPKARRRGVAKALLEEVKAAARAAGAGAITLDVRAGNEGALGFYEAAGFERVDLWPAYYNHPVEDGVAMALAL